jgi:hypothetical protein
MGSHMYNQDQIEIGTNRGSIRATASVAVIAIAVLAVYWFGL